MLLISILISTFTLFFIFTRNSVVRLVNADGLRIEIHMQIFAIIIYLRNKESDKGQQKSKINRRVILESVRRLIRKGSIKINNLRLPWPKEENPFKEIRYRILYAATISYFESISDGFSIKDNAIILSPDAKELQYDISITSRLYEVVYSITRLAYHKIKEKTNVRE